VMTFLLPTYRSALEQGEIVSRPILTHKVNPLIEKWDSFLESKKMRSTLKVERIFFVPKYLL